MRPPETFLGQPIRDLQTMLRVIAKANHREFSLVPDGIYSPKTAQAVASFQQAHGLPATGITDQTTWEAILEAYTPARIQLRSAQSLQILMGINQVIRKGEKHAHVYLAQGMLTVLCNCYRTVTRPTFTGILDNQTADSLSSFQKLCRLPVTGNLDKITWKHLALQYPLAANLDNLSEIPNS